MIRYRIGAVLRTSIFMTGSSLPCLTELKGGSRGWTQWKSYQWYRLPRLRVRVRRRVVVSLRVPVPVPTPLKTRLTRKWPTHSRNKLSSKKITSKFRPNQREKTNFPQQIPTSRSRPKQREKTKSQPQKTFPSRVSCHPANATNSLSSTMRGPQNSDLN